MRHQEGGKQLVALVKAGIGGVHARRGESAGLGATIGATIGSALGGPVGALVGATLGVAASIALGERR